MAPWEYVSPPTTVPRFRCRSRSVSLLKESLRLFFIRVSSPRYKVPGTGRQTTCPNSVSVCAGKRAGPCGRPSKYVAECQRFLRTDARNAPRDLEVNGTPRRRPQRRARRTVVPLMGSDGWRESRNSGHRCSLVVSSRPNRRWRYRIPRTMFRTGYRHTTSCTSTACSPTCNHSSPCRRWCRSRKCTSHSRCTWLPGNTCLRRRRSPDSAAGHAASPCSRTAFVSSSFESPPRY
jgi:hypothetical protein